MPNPLPSISGLLTLLKPQTAGRLKLNLTSAALNDCTHKSFFGERGFCLQVLLTLAVPSEQDEAISI